MRQQVPWLLYLIPNPKTILETKPEERER